MEKVKVVAGRTYWTGNVHYPQRVRVEGVGIDWLSIPEKHKQRARASGWGPAMAPYAKVAYPGSVTGTSYVPTSVLAQRLRQA